jgi:hypothetical protein
VNRREFFKFTSTGTIVLTACQPTVRVTRELIANRDIPIRKHWKFDVAMLIYFVPLLEWTAIRYALENKVESDPRS